MAMDTWKFAGHYSTYGRTAGPFAAMKAEIPRVYNTCRISGDPEEKLFTSGEKMMYTPGVFADSTVNLILNKVVTQELKDSVELTEPANENYVVIHKSSHTSGTCDIICE